MIDQIAKIIPLVTVAGGTAVSSPQIKSQIQKLLTATTVVATQQEVNDLAKIVYLDVIGENRPKPEDFQSYVRKNMLAKNNSPRDTSQDMWGTPYGLAYDEKNAVLYVISAGPDKAYNTTDDIYASYKYRD